MVDQSFLPDVKLSFGIQGTDGDGDKTQIETIDLAIDGDGSGDFFLF